MYVVLWEMSIQILFPFLSRLFCFIYYWLLWIPYVFWLLIHYLIYMICKYFLSLCRFLFYFGDYFLLKEYVVPLISKLFKSLVWKLWLLVSYKGKTKSANISSKKCRFSPLFLKNLACYIITPWTIDELWIEISGKHVDSSWKD